MDEITISLTDDEAEQVRLALEERNDFLARAERSSELHSHAQRAALDGRRLIVAVQLQLADAIRGALASRRAS